MVVYSAVEIRVLRVEGQMSGWVSLRLQDLLRNVAVQEPVDVSVGGHRVSFRLAFRDSHQPYVEILFDTPPDDVMAIREVRLTYPEVFIPPRPDLPRPVMFNWAVGEVLRFKGPDASMVTLELKSVPKGRRRRFKLELNKNVTERLLYETWDVKLSGKLIRLQAQPGPVEDMLRLYAVAPPEIVVSD